MKLSSLELNFLSVNFFDLLIAILSSVSAISLIALVSGLFNPTLCFLFGFLLVFLMFYFFPRLFISEKPVLLSSLPNVLLVTLLLISALFFRQEPFIYIMGGQDQGVYVNMSSYFQHKGNVEIRDTMRDLIEDPNVLYTYDFRPGDFFEPGVFKTNKAGNYVFQFYHLFPVWMAIFGEVFGDINRYYALTFFSLLSILSAYFLVTKTTKSYFWGIVAGVLLALNPLHVFFSRWPVTEVPALCFSLCGFYYLANSFDLYQSNNNSNKHLYLNLSLSAFCFGLLFFTRISGFMYIPVFLIILFFAPLEKDKIFSRALVFYATAVFIFFSISVWYGFTYSQPYSLAIYEASFSRLLGQKWQQPLFILLLITIVFFVSWIKITWRNLEIQNWLVSYNFNIINFIWWLISSIAVLALLLGIYKAYLLGFTDRYADNPWVGQRWHLWGQGWKSIGYISLFVAVTYISPVLFLLLFGISWTLRKSIHGLFAWFFFTMFWAYICLLQWNIPYQYYYARYLVSEVVPYGIICAVIGLSLVSNKKWRKALLILAILTTLPYYAYYLVPQLKGREGIAQYIALNEISKEININDMIIFDGNNSRITTPLIYYFDKNLFPVFNMNELIEVAKWAIKHPAIDKVFLMTQNVYNEGFLSPVKTVQYKENIFETVGRIPVNFITRQQYNIYLLRVTEDILNINNSDFYSTFFNITNKLTIKIEGFHNDRVWTKSNFRIYLANVDLASIKEMNILTYNYLPRAIQINDNTLKITLNNIPISLLERRDDAITFSLPEQLREKQDQVIIEGHIDTWIPKNLGINQDPRELGLDIKAIEFK